MTRERKRLPKWLRFFVVEGWPFIVLLFALAIEFAHIASSSWLNVFLYNGDSLTLPIIRQTLAHKEPFLWVSSSQLLLFPEGLLYALSSTIVKSIRGSLVLNGVINIFLLYALIRWMSGILLKTRVYFKQLVALGACLLLILYMLLERQPLVNSSSVATLFLFNTYYYGVILSGAFLLCVMLLLANNKFSFRKLGRLGWSLILLSFIVASLTTFSDPVFIIQFLAPFLLAILLTVVLNGLKLKNALLMAIPVLVGSMAGYMSRLFFKSFVGQSLGSHIITQQIPGTLTVFHTAISFDLHSKAGFLELSLVLLVMFFSLVYSLWWVYKKTRTRSLLDGRFLLIGLFSVLAPVFVVGFSIFTGSLVTRYLLPLVIFPLLGLLPLLTVRTVKLNRLKTAVLPASIILFGIIVLFGVFSMGKVGSLLSSNYPGAQCLASALNNKPAVGIGQYWNARPLTVYGKFNEEVLQVNTSLSPYLWQSNLGAYHNRRFSFIIVDKEMTSPRALTDSDPNIPKHPSRIVSCSDFYVYIYSPGTPGYTQLNNGVASYYETLVKIRTSGSTEKLY